MIFPTHEVLRQSQHMKRMSSRVEACSVALLRKTSQQARQSSVANCSKRGRAQVGFVSVLCSSAIFGTACLSKVSAIASAAAATAAAATAAAPVVPTSAMPTSATATATASAAASTKDGATS